MGSMPSIRYDLNLFTQSFPILFMITDISLSELGNSSLITVLVSSVASNFTYQGSEKTTFANDGRCSTVILRSSPESKYQSIAKNIKKVHHTYLESTNFTVIMSAHVFTSVQLLALAATYRIYDGDYLLYESSHMIDVLEFPYQTPNDLIPIIRTGEYVVEGTIFGPVDGFPMGVTLFQGATKIRLTPNIEQNVQISMLYTGSNL